jgi:hypothetical protein
MYQLDLSEVPSGMPLAVDEETPVPNSLSLDPGFPNPFTTQTTLSYYLPAAAEVRLEVFDVAGRRVTTLANGLVAEGSHTAVWDAGIAASGAYLARLTVTSSAGHSTHTTLLTRVR